MTEDRAKDSARGEMRIAWTLGGLAVLIQMLTNGRYGYFRDELYYLACSDHLAFGYVDFAPLIAWIAHFSRLVLGDSLHAIRVVPALAFGGEVVLTGAIARGLGGRRWAVLLASISVLVCPVVLANGARLAMNPLEPLFWMGCVYFLLLAINREQPKLLLWCGVLLGLGMENKHSTVFFLGALLVGLLATSHRRLIATRWFWVAAGIAFLIALPNAIWQYAYHFPTLQDLRNVKAMHKNVELPPLPFLRQQIMMLLPASALVWIAGLGFLLFHRDGKKYRVLGVTYLAFLAILMALRGKDYYLAPIYPMLYAAGGVLWEKWAESRPWLRWLRVAVPAVVTAMDLSRRRWLFLSFRPSGSCRTWTGWGSRSRKGRPARARCCRSTSPMSSDGPRWSRRWLASITRCRRSSVRKRRSWRAITERLARSTSSARATASRKPSAATRTTTIGDRDSTPAKASSCWSGASSAPSAGAAAWTRAPPSRLTTAWAGSITTF